ncbi:MAG: hypothetical protein ACNYPH_05200 [Gammaproteobacteria bacterium WSBS_2016_MAG_OTU1]
MKKIPSQEIHVLAVSGLKSLLPVILEIAHNPKTSPSQKLNVTRLVRDIYSMTGDFQLNAQLLGTKEKTIVNFKVSEKEWAVKPEGKLRHLPSYEEGQRELIEAGALDKHSNCAKGCVLIKVVENSKRNPHDGEKPV